MHGYPVAAGAILLILAARNWHYEKAPRLTAWFFGIGAFLTTIGVTLWLDALAGLTGARLRIVSVGAQREQTFQV